MMADAARIPPPHLEHHVPLFRRFGSLLRMAIAVILCLTPLTAILVMGWLMRAMRVESAAARLRLEDPANGPPRPSLPNWLLSRAGTERRGLRRWTGSMASNIRLGFASLLTTAACTLPFTLLWLFSWWGGWENSFSKGYEQAWVGPSVGLLGVAISFPLLTHLPMALAHQAETRRVSAFFSISHVRRLIRQVGWRYTWLCLAIVITAFPLFVAKSAPVFVENWSPGFLDRNADELAKFAANYRLAATIYLVLAVTWWRRAVARLYARAAWRLEQLEATGVREYRVVTWTRTMIIWLIWFGLVAQIFIGQFMNHQWVAWLNPPLLGLPWISTPGTAM